MAAIVHVSEQASLAIVEISTASLTFLFATLATAYRGFTVAKVGFIYLSICSLIHIIGSACYVGGELSGGNSGLQDVYAICNFISVGPLIMASLAFSHYSDETATSRGGTAVLLSALQIIPVVGLVLAIAGGVQYSLGATPTTDPGNSGVGLLQAASIVFLISMTTLVIMTAVNVSYARTLRTLAVTVSMPFLGIRVILDILEAWASTDSQFNFNLPTFPVQIFMRFIMEFIVVMLFLFTGLGALANPHDHLAGGRDSADGSGAESKLSQRTETPLIAPPAIAHQGAGSFHDGRSFQDGPSFQEGRSFNDGRSF